MSSWCSAPSGLLPVLLELSDHAGWATPPLNESALCCSTRFCTTGAASPWLRATHRGTSAQPSHQPDVNAGLHAGDRHGLRLPAASGARGAEPTGGPGPTNHLFTLLG